MMDADVVVAGAGHNSLIAAAYLTRAGYRCRVLDARPIPGGGVASEQALLPGYRLDSCSTGHTLIQQNPLLTGDELGLISERGLTHLAPDPVARGAAVTATVNPAAASLQRKSLLLDDFEIVANAVDPDAAPSTTVAFNLPANAPPGTHLARVRIDGAESRLTINPVTLQYTGPTLTVT